MSKKEQGEKSVTIYVAIIGGVFAVIAACIGLGTPIIEWGLSKINPTPSQVEIAITPKQDITSMPVATTTNTRIPPTKFPTFTIAPPTKTLKPTDIPPTNTPTIQPNTGLQLGQTYRQGNIAFTVVSVDYDVAGGFYSGNYISINVEVKNISQSSISFTYGDPTFTVKDNHGTIYKDGFATAKGRTFEDSKILSSGDSSRLDGYLCCGLAYGVDHSDASITEIFFIVENLSSIEYAEWVIPINH